MTKYKITIEFESSEVVDKDLDMECETLRSEFEESDLYNLKGLSVKWEEELEEINLLPKGFKEVKEFSTLVDKEGPSKEDIVGVNHPAELGEI